MRFVRIAALTLVALLLLSGVLIAEEPDAEPAPAAPVEAPPSELDRALDRLTVGGVAAAVYQYQFMKDGGDDMGRGTFVVEPEIGFALGEHGKFFLKFGFGAGNSLAGDSEFTQSPWGGNDEAAYQDINGRDRSYLLTSWYRHAFPLGESGDDGEVAVTGGIIDATDYLDGNAYANDEYTQFMNGALVNGPNTFLPSYDLGGAVEVAWGRWHLNAVGMYVGDNGEGRSFHYYGFELGVTLESDLGVGHYRLLLDTTTEDFADPTGQSLERAGAWILSCDQQLGEGFGAWIRFNAQRADAATDYRRLHSGGLNLDGSLWGREGDEIGIGYAYLSGGNIEFGGAHVFEVYGNVRLEEHLLVTLDIQYQNDEIDGVPNPEGWVIGGRIVVEF